MNGEEIGERQSKQGIKCKKEKEKKSHLLRLQALKLKKKKINIYLFCFVLDPNLAILTTCYQWSTLRHIGFAAFPRKGQLKWLAFAC